MNKGNELDYPYEVNIPPGLSWEVFKKEWGISIVKDYIVNVYGQRGYHVTYSFKDELVATAFALKFK